MAQGHLTENRHNGSFLVEMLARVRGGTEGQRPVGSYAPRPYGPPARGDTLPRARAPPPRRRSRGAGPGGGCSAAHLYGAGDARVSTDHSGCRAGLPQRIGRSHGRREDGPTVAPRGGKANDGTEQWFRQHGYDGADYDGTAQHGDGKGTPLYDSRQAPSPMRMDTIIHILRV